MLFRLLIWATLIYLGYRLIKNLLLPPPDQPSVKGKPRTRPLDLDDADIEDADFREVKDE